MTDDVKQSCMGNSKFMTNKDTFSLPFVYNSQLMIVLMLVLPIYLLFRVSVALNSRSSIFHQLLKIHVS